MLSDRLSKTTTVAMVVVGATIGLSFGVRAVVTDDGTRIVNSYQQVLGSSPSAGCRFPNHVERVIGSIRRECLDHVVGVNEAGLQRVLSDYLAYYLQILRSTRTRPSPRAVVPPSAGRVVARPQVGGLHHRYNRVAG